MLAGNMRGGRATTSSTCQIPIPACIRTSRRTSATCRRKPALPAIFHLLPAGLPQGPYRPIPTASIWDSCFLLVMPGLVPLLSGLAIGRSRAGVLGAQRLLSPRFPSCLNAPPPSCSGHDGRERAGRRASKPLWAPINDRWYKSAIRGWTPARAFRARRTRSPSGSNPSSPATPARAARAQGVVEDGRSRH